MNDRSGLLWDISRHFGRFGAEEIRSVPQLRSLYPNISAAYPKLGLAELAEVLDRLQKGEEIKPPEQLQKLDGRHRNRKAKLSDEEIRDRRANGQSLGAIAKLAGVSRSRIGQICGPDRDRANQRNFSLGRYSIDDGRNLHGLRFRVFTDN